jgi:hypothetical protein
MFALTYKLDDNGWATAAVSNGDATISVLASYLTDALGDLARAARGLLRGQAEVTFSFVEEPGQHRFVITRRADDLDIKIFHLPRAFASGVEGGRLVFSATSDVRSFANSAINCLRNVLDEVGETEYRRRWRNHDFPRQVLDDLLLLRRESAAVRPAK